MTASLTNLIYHVIFSTKHRHPMICDDIRNDLYAYIREIIHKRRGHLIEIGGVEDHIHLVVRLRSNICLADLLRFVKANSSRWMNEKTALASRFLWQGGYGAFTVSISRLLQLRRYVQTQREHHQMKSFQDEYNAFLIRHELPYEQDELWS